MTCLHRWSNYPTGFTPLDLLIYPIGVKCDIGAISTGEKWNIGVLEKIDQLHYKIENE